MNVLATAVRAHRAAARRNEISSRPAEPRGPESHPQTATADSPEQVSLSRRLVGKCANFGVRVGTVAAVSAASALLLSGPAVMLPGLAAAVVVSWKSCGDIASRIKHAVFGGNFNRVMGIRRGTVAGLGGGLPALAAWTAGILFPVPTLAVAGAAAIGGTALKMGGY